MWLEAREADQPGTVIRHAWPARHRPGPRIMRLVAVGGLAEFIIFGHLAKLGPATWNHVLVQDAVAGPKFTFIKYLF